MDIVLCYFQTLLIDIADSCFLYLKDLQTLSMVSLLYSDIMFSAFIYIFVLCFSLIELFAIIVVLFGHCVSVYHWFISCFQLYNCIILLW